MQAEEEEIHLSRMVSVGKQGDLGQVGACWWPENHLGTTMEIRVICSPIPVNSARRQGLMTRPETPQDAGFFTEDVSSVHREVYHVTELAC